MRQALLDDDPTQARRHLARAHHLFKSIAADYQMAWCELFLARVDQRLGLNPRSRLKALSQRPLGAWPLLRAELAIARAEIYGNEQPERARDLILRARGFATRQGHMSLARALDGVLVAQRLMSSDSLDELTPVDPLPAVETGGSYAADQLTFASVAQPQPFIIEDAPLRAGHHTGKRGADDDVLVALDVNDTRAHANAGLALQALDLLLPAANDDDRAPARLEVPAPRAGLLALRASRSRGERTGTRRSQLTLVPPPNDGDVV